METLSSAWSFVRVFISSLFGIVSILSGVATLVLWLASRTGSEWSKRAEKWRGRAEAVSAVLVVLAAYQVWIQERQMRVGEVMAARDSLGLWRSRGDSLERALREATDSHERVARSAERAQTEAAIERLGKLIEEGDALKDKCLHGPYRPIDDTARWGEATRKYLRAALGPGYVIRFNQAPPSLGAFDGSNIQMMALWNDVDGKQAALAEFVKELQARLQ